MRLAWIVAVAACAPSPVAPRPAPAPPEARIEVAPASCPPAGEAEAALRRVVVARGAQGSGLRIHVASTPTDAGHDVELRVVRASGELGLDRRYSLALADCASAAPLLALAVDRFLTSFPEWAGPPPLPPPAPAPPPSRGLDVAIVGALNTIWRPLGIDGQVGAIADLGGDRDRLGASLLLRGSVPQAAGDGHFQQTSLLAGASWRRRLGSWQLRGELRGGAVLVSGIGFHPSHRAWLPWAEAAGFAGRAMSWGALGVEIAAAPLRDRAVTSDGLVSEDIPLLRIGLSAEFGVKK